MLHDLLNSVVVIGTAISLVSLAIIFIGIGLLLVHRRLERLPFAVRAVYDVAPKLCYDIIASKPRKEKSFSSKVMRRYELFCLKLHGKLGFKVS